MALKMTMSFLAEEEKHFKPLPKEQCLTEETLIALERHIAKSNRRNEEMLEKSYKFAQESYIPASILEDDSIE